jgi:hypothetical protein
MAVGAHYGHVIKHLEPEHVAALPIVDCPEEEVKGFTHDCERVRRARDQACAEIDAAEEEYARVLRLDEIEKWGGPGFIVGASEMLRGRRRLDAEFHQPDVAAALRLLERCAQRIESLDNVTSRIWWPGRFQRVFGDNGTPYFSAAELFDVNAPDTKRIYAGLVNNNEDYRVQPGWLLMARSGQVYGLNGRVMLASQRIGRAFISEDLIRIVPRSDRIRPGYLLMVLGHPLLGRPLVIRHAYGTSIPHLEPSDLRDVAVPRLAAEVEAAIAGRMEKAVRLQAEADELEDTLTTRAEQVVQRYLQRGRVRKSGA